MGDLSLDITNLQEALEAEFCPPLETTLVAAFIADHISAETNLTKDVLKTLREQLYIIAASAAADQVDQELSKDMLDLQLSISTDDSPDADSVFSQGGLETSSNSNSAISTSSPPEDPSSTESQSALAFLQASFPNIPVKKLKTHLTAADLLMEKIVEDLLSEQYVRELEERGLEGEVLDDQTGTWTVVSKKAKAPSTKKRKAKGKTFILNDIRQRQYQRRPKSQTRSAGDPWNEIISLSSYLETLLPRPSSVFQSYFHKPEYSTPASALRAALANIEQQKAKNKAPSKDSQDRTTILLTLLEFVSSSEDFDYENLDSEARARLLADAELCLAAADWSPDNAFEVVKLLYELEMDNESTQEMGVYHSPAAPILSAGLIIKSNDTGPSTWAGSSSDAPLLPVASPSIPLDAPSNIPKDRPPPAPSQSGWQHVPVRRKPPAIHPSAAFIPAYNPNNVPKRKGRPVHPSLMNPSSLRSPNMGTATGHRSPISGGYKARIDACHARRDEALRTASQHWMSGGARGLGGEVAFFYAQEAQRHQAEAQKLQLDAMRMRVDSKRFATADTDTLDVHYCTASEALTIVCEVLEEGWVTSARPLRIITGKGNHSSGRVAVLGPAVTKVLESDGWVVGKWDGGISVYGRARS